MRRIALFIMVIFCTLEMRAQVSCIREDFLKWGYEEYDGTEMKLLPSGEVKFQDLIHDISEAKRYVHAEYYKWWNDSIGRAVLDTLAAKVREGVNVRVLVDAYGNKSKKAKSTQDFIRYYQDLGIQFVIFDPFKFPYLNHIWPRLHRKMVIIDGEKVYTGGMNIAQYYIHGRPGIRRWRDMHCCLTGPIVNAYEYLFSLLWYKKTGEYVDYQAYEGTRKEAGCPAFVIDRKPGKESDAIRRSYISCLDHAQRYVRILNPYIIPSPSVLKAMHRALKRGVKLEVMCSMKGDGVASEASTAREVRALEKRGAVVWLCKDGFHHDKIVIVDDSLCSVGTANLDARSLAFDYEVNAWLFSTEYCRELNSYYDAEIAKSEQLTENNWKSMYLRSRRRLGWWLKSLRLIL